MKKKLSCGIETLDHFFVYSSKLSLTKTFYCEILGLEDGPRPAFDFPGYWFYLSGKPVIHVGTNEFSGGLERTDNDREDDTGTIDHVAFRCKGFSGFIARFQEYDQQFKTHEIPDFDLKQIFIRDPNGVTIELNFFGE